MVLKELYFQKTNADKHKRIKDMYIQKIKIRNSLRAHRMKKKVLTSIDNDVI